MTKPHPIPASEFCFNTASVQRIECELCGTRCYSSTVAGDVADASFSARGWQVMLGAAGAALQVCRRCSRKLGPAWTAADAGK